MNFVPSFCLASALALTTGCSAATSSPSGGAGGNGSSGGGSSSGSVFGGGSGGSTTTFAGTYTGTLTTILSEDGTTSSPATASVTWTVTQNGDEVNLGMAYCPAAGGTANGDTVSVYATTCPTADSITTTYTGGTVTLDGCTLTVDLTDGVVGDGVTATGTWTGTLTSTSSACANGIGSSSGSSSGGSSSSGSSSGSGSGSGSGVSTTESFVGTWDIAFEWAGRTPGELTLVVATDQTCQQLAGPGVGATSGSSSVTGDTVTWVLEDGSTWTGTETGDAKISGTMKSSGGTTGTFNGSIE